MTKHPPRKGRNPSSNERLAREQGTVHKDWGGRLPIGLVYPNSYSVGMSNLGLQTIYRRLNDYPDIVCERAFWEAGATRRAPAVSVESERPLYDFAVLAFSVSYELDYFNIPRVLEAGGIPVYAAQRDERHPLIIGGGPCLIANPMPVAPFFDAIGVGEAEPIMPRLVPVLREGAGSPRPDLLRNLARIPGLFVPQCPSPGSIARQWAKDIDEYRVTSTVLTPDTELGDLYLVEVERGCGWSCRFCLLCTAFRPMRSHSVEKILEYAREGLHYRKRIGLVGPAVTDHPRIEDIMSGLREMGAEISISSLRLSTLTPGLMEHMAAGGIKTITIAPEAGSARLRGVIRKDITEEQVTEAVEMAAARAMQLKLYFMVGLPSETDEDISEIVRLTLRAKEVADRYGRGRRITVNLSPFVPKAGTPFQWLPMASVPVIEQRAAYIQGRLAAAGIKANLESPAWSEVQAVLARGDERLAGVLADMPSRTLAAWQKTAEKHHIDTHFYAHQRWPADAKLPWSIIDSGVSREKLKQELETALG